MRDVEGAEQDGEEVDETARLVELGQRSRRELALAGGKKVNSLK